MTGTLPTLDQGPVEVEGRSKVKGESEGRKRGTSEPEARWRDERVRWGPSSVDAVGVYDFLPSSGTSSTTVSFLTSV